MVKGEIKLWMGSQNNSANDMYYYLDQFCRTPTIVGSFAVEEPPDLESRVIAPLLACYNATCFSHASATGSSGSIAHFSLHAAACAGAWLF